MSTAAQTFTADELWRMPGDQRRELVRGELRTMAPAGFEHGRIIMNLARSLANHVVENELGVVLGAETGFKLARNPDTVRGADIAFIAASRIPAGSLPVGYWEGAPDLAVEVVSPNDAMEDVDEKVDEYLAAGAGMVWVLQPRRRTATVHRPGQNPVVLRDGDHLDSGQVVPGFTCPVNELFEQGEAGSIRPTARTSF